MFSRRLSILIISQIMVACQSISNVYSTWTKRPHNEEFIASDGQLFPSFVYETFPKSKHFEKIVPDLERVKRGLQIIEIKRLNNQNNFFNESNLSWSLNGTYLSYEQIDLQNRQIQVQSLNGKYSKTLKLRPKKNSMARSAGLYDQSLISFNSGLSWSPDSHRYAFMSNGGIGVYRIYIGSLQGKEKVIANSSTREGFASWSPKSNELAFVSARSGNGDLYLLSIEDRRPLRLTNSSDPEIFPDWLPDGSGIIYSSGKSNNHRLEIVRKSDNQWQRPIALTDWNKDDIRPKISPCGKWVAFYSREISGEHLNAHWNLHIIKVQSSPYQEVDFRGTILDRNVVADLNTGPAWSPDGQKIFYIKKDPQRFNPIFMADLSTGKKYIVPTNTKMNRDIMMSPLGVLSFRAQVGAWDKVYIALTNQGKYLQPPQPLERALLKTPRSKYRLKRHSLNSLDLRPLPKRIY